MTVAVTLNSRGTAVQGAGATASPVPPISNCLGKLVCLVITQTSSLPSVSSITGATYRRAAITGIGEELSVYIKNGQSVEPTPQINFANMSGTFMAQIFVLDISGARFPVISADGQGVLALSTPTSSLQTSQLYVGYTGLTGNGFVIQFGKKNTAGGGLATGVATTAGFVQVALGLPTAINRSVLSAQLLIAPTTVGSGVSTNTATIAGNADNGSQARATIEFAVVTAISPSVVAMDNANDRLVVASDPGVDGVVRVKLRAKVPAATATSDFLARASQTMWAHDFRTASEVNAFRWYDGVGNDPNNLGKPADCIWDPTDGIGGNLGCLKIFHRAGLQDPPHWWHPIGCAFRAGGNGKTTDDPAVGVSLATWAPTQGGTQLQNFIGGYFGHQSYWAASPGYFIGDVFYLQIRLKKDAALESRDPPGVATVGKNFWITTTRNTSTAQQLVCYANNNNIQSGITGKPLYAEFYQGVGNAPLGQVATTANGTQVQLGSELGVVGAYCDPYHQLNQGACWTYSGGWDTLLIEIHCGRAGIADTQFRCFAQHDLTLFPSEAGQYKKIWDVFYPAGFDANDTWLKNGWNALTLACYFNGFAGDGTDHDIWHKFAQVIASRNFIPAPLV